MHINPISSTNPVSDDSNDETLEQQLWDLIEQLRAHMNDKDPSQESVILQKLQDFLQKNASQIEQLCYANGYRQDSGNWTEHYGTFLNQSMDLIQTMLKNPQGQINHAGLDLLNEMATQLSFLMKKPS